MISLARGHARAHVAIHQIAGLGEGRVGVVAVLGCGTVVVVVHLMLDTPLRADEGTTDTRRRSTD